ncbi:MAG: dihydrofolate reductase [Gammaproteobacteria bacterium]|jgi:dihydrofolate reductase
MKISLVVAMTADRVIGRGNQLPWHLPADLRHFRKLTTGKAIIMGRKTHESIGRPLPERTNIVVTRNAAYRAPGCIVVHSLEEALQAAARHGEAMVIGGADLYRQALPGADSLYITLIRHEFEGDTFFPALEDAEWREVGRIDCEADDKNAWPYSFIHLQRIT